MKHCVKFVFLLLPLFFLFASSCGRTAEQTPQQKQAVVDTAPSTLREKELIEYNDTRFKIVERDIIFLREVPQDEKYLSIVEKDIIWLESPAKSLQLEDFDLLQQLIFGDSTSIVDAALPMSSDTIEISIQDHTMKSAENIEATNDTFQLIYTKPVIAASGDDDKNEEEDGPMPIPDEMDHMDNDSKDLEDQTDDGRSGSASTPNVTYNNKNFDAYKSNQFYLTIRKPYIVLMGVAYEDGDFVKKMVVYHFDQVSKLTSATINDRRNYYRVYRK